MNYLLKKDSHGKKPFDVQCMTEREMQGFHSSRYDTTGQVLTSPGSVSLMKSSYLVLD